MRARALAITCASAAILLLAAYCRGVPPSAAASTSLPLELVTETALPGRAVRFDYQDIDASTGRLYIAHMNDASVVVVSIKDGSLLRVIDNIPTPRGVVVAHSSNRVFVTSSPDRLVIIDGASLAVLARVQTGRAPDGVAWDEAHALVGVSDQADGALSLLAEAGTGPRRQVQLGRETGNVVFDPRRKLFWITVLSAKGAGQLSAVEPLSGSVVARLPLPGCAGAHGLRLHPDGKSALVACEDNSQLVRIELEGAHTSTRAPSGQDPDVLAIDPGLGLLYVAAESGDVRIFDLLRPGLVELGREHPGNASHSVAVDSASHHVFFPLASGAAGKPILRIFKPRGT